MLRSENRLVDLLGMYCGCRVCMYKKFWEGRNVEVLHEDLKAFVAVVALSSERRDVMPHGPHPFSH